MTIKKSIFAMAAWYFLALNPGGGGIKVGPFSSQLKCDTYRMRIAHTRATSNCMQPQPRKKK